MLEHLISKINVTETQHTSHTHTTKVPPLVAFGKTVMSLECGEALEKSLQYKKILVPQ